MFLAEAFRFSIQALLANPVRSLLTCLGMLIGNASVILVVTISLTSQEYILDQIQAIGSNMIFAYYETGTLEAARFQSDFIKLADVEAVREQLRGSIVEATGVMTNSDRILVNGTEQDIRVIGSDENYQPVRNLAVLSGRFLDHQDVIGRAKVAVLNEKLARRLYGSLQAGTGQIVKIYGLQFTVVGTFKERIDSFGQTEVTGESVLIPITVLKYFTQIERIDPLYVQVKSSQQVEAVTARVRQILQSRHRTGATYRVENLQAILGAARNISVILRLVLILVAAIALIISGIGIMNIMLVTVTERTREIGVRMAVGASRAEILAQFLTEAILISLVGGVAGILAGVSVPLSVDLFADNLHVPVSPASVLVAFGVSCTVGLAFGLLPANRASRLNPTEALRYE
ncbi:MAG: ABC transporter permease [Candidatus Solibacter usitatus]|nr:ABC transporter permease [Candidatus Solibacter usitatus]